MTDTCNDTIDTAIGTITCDLPAGHGDDHAGGDRTYWRHHPEPTPPPVPLVAVGNLTIRRDEAADGTPLLDLDAHPSGACLTPDQAEQVGLAILGWGRTEQRKRLRQQAYGEVAGSTASPTTRTAPPRSPTPTTPSCSA